MRKLAGVVLACLVATLMLSTLMLSGTVLAQEEQPPPPTDGAACEQYGCGEADPEPEISEVPPSGGFEVPAGLSCGPVEKSSWYERVDGIEYQRACEPFSSPDCLYLTVSYNANGEIIRTESACPDPNREDCVTEAVYYGAALTQYHDAIGSCPISAISDVAEQDAEQIGRAVDGDRSSSPETERVSASDSPSDADGSAGMSEPVGLTDEAGAGVPQDESFGTDRDLAGADSKDVYGRGADSTYSSESSDEVYVDSKSSGSRPLRGVDMNYRLPETGGAPWSLLLGGCLVASLGVVSVARLRRAS